MASDSRIRKTLEQLSEKIQEQQWFQQAKAKWEELDIVTRFYVKIGSIGGVVLLVFVFAMVSVFKVRALKAELASKTQLRMMIQSATEELRILRSKGGGPSGGDAFPNWQAAVKFAAGNAGIDEASLELGAEKPGEKKPTVNETLVDVKTKKITIKQLIRYALQLESSSTPVKIKALAVDAEDPEGYINTTLSLSIFELKKSQ